MCHVFTCVLSLSQQRGRQWSRCWTAAWFEDTPTGSRQWGRWGWGSRSRVGCPASSWCAWGTRGGPHTGRVPGVRGEGALNSALASTATCLTAAECIIPFVGAVGEFYSISLFLQHLIITISDILQWCWNCFTRDICRLHQESLRKSQNGQNGPIKVSRNWKATCTFHMSFPVCWTLQPAFLSPCCLWHCVPCTPPAGRSSGSRWVVQRGRRRAWLSETLASSGRSSCFIICFDPLNLSEERTMGNEC